MSELDVDALAAMLSAELALPHRTVHWACPFGFGAGLTSALRHAIRALLCAPRGGLLVVHLARGRGTPAPARARSVLLSALDRIQVTDIRSVPCADGLAIACVLAPALRPPITGARAPVTGADLTALRTLSARPAGPPCGAERHRRGSHPRRADPGRCWSRDPLR